MDYSLRIKRLREEMNYREIDLLFLTPSTDLFYLTGIKERMMERLVLLIVTKEEIHFIAPSFELGNLNENIRPLLTMHGWSDGQDPFNIMEKFLTRKKCTVAAGRNIPSWVLLNTMEKFPNYHWESADEMLVTMRSIKDEHEYGLLKKAQHGSCRAFERLLTHSLCGMKEYEVAKLLMLYTEQEGMETLGGIPIVASGTNSALPHYHTGDRIISKGDVVVIDFGGEHRGIGYQADTTRTVVVKQAPDGFEEIYQVVLGANMAAFNAAKPGVCCQDVDFAARKVIEEAGYGKFFTHRLGHGIGLDVHEHPYITDGNLTPIKVGNVFSDEPGIYIPGKYGVRIEDQLFIHNYGAERLTPLKHKLMIVD